MAFSLEFETENAAFEENGTMEIVAILEMVGMSLENGNTGGYVKDSNGNRVGSWSWS